MEGQVMAIYQHIRHPRIASRLADRPVKVADLLPAEQQPHGSAATSSRTGLRLPV
jgi:hypothetical protein